MNETKSFLDAIGSEMNEFKSATNSKVCESMPYFGKQRKLQIPVNIETASSTISKDSFDNVKHEILKRVKNLCASKLKLKNLFKATNEIYYL